MNLNYCSKLFENIDGRIIAVKKVQGRDPLGNLVREKFETDIAKHLTSLHDEYGPGDMIDEIRDSATAMGANADTAAEMHKKIFINIGRTASAVAFIFDSVDKPITDVGIQLFYELLFGDPSFRKMEAFIQSQNGENVPLSKPDDILGLLKKLLEEFPDLSNNQNVHPITSVAYFHSQFLRIHPFIDGNGRVARLLMNIMLMSAGYFPILIGINDRVDYYNSLAAADNGKIEELTEFLAQKELDTIELFTQTGGYLSLAAKVELEEKISRIEGVEKCIVLTEDKNYEDGLQTLFLASGFVKNETRFIAYEGCSKIDSVALYTLITKEKFPHIRIIVHRDRDYLTNGEVAEQSKKLDELHNTYLFVTKGTDVESHFVNKDHILACHPTLTPSIVEQIIADGIIAEQDVAIDRIRTKEFGMSHKKKSSHLDQALIDLYKSNTFRFTVGKPLLKRIKAGIQSELKSNPNLNQPTTALAAPDLVVIAKEIWVS
jgi:prophage maintenance system killer protein